MSKSSKRRSSSKQHFARSPLFIVLGVVLASLAAMLAWVSLTGATGKSNVGSRPIEVTGQPKLAVDREQIDLGNVRLGQAVQAKFELANTGDQLLRFTQVPIIQVVEGC